MLYFNTNVGATLRCEVTIAIVQNPMLRGVRFPPVRPAEVNSIGAKE